MANYRPKIDRSANLTTGRVFRAFHKGDYVNGTGMSPQAVLNVVSRYSCKCGFTVKPHDLRRTFAKLSYKGGAGLDQVSLSLGHASLQTTERYLGLAQSLTDAPCDHIDLGI